MAARRCSTCKRNHPLGVKKCPTCGRATRRNYNVAPDPIARKPWVSKDALPEVVLPAVTKDRLREWPAGSGNMWISDEALEYDGYGPGEHLEAGTIIKVLANSTNIYFELASHAVDGGLGGWWVQRIESPEEMFRDLPITAEDDAR